MLCIVPTPVGNLEDMTPRGVRMLAEADFIACEDTRTSMPLLRRYGISKPLIAYHAFNEKGKTEALVERLLRGEKGALISDAGTPGISDPGYELIRRCIDEGVEMTALPGPTAFVPALILSGLPPYPFLFYGFLPDKQGERERAILSVASVPWTLLFYVSPHKAEKHLLHLCALLGDRRAALVREISKIYEEWTGALIDETIAKIEAAGEVKGEVVVLLRPPDAAEEAPEPEGAEDLP